MYNMIYNSTGKIKNKKKVTSRKYHKSINTYT